MMNSLTAAQEPITNCVKLHINMTAVACVVMAP